MGDLDDSLDLEMAAASLRSDMSDVRVFLRVLAGNLTAALADRVKLEHAGGRFRKSDEIKQMIVSMGNEQYVAALDGSVLNCSIARSSGGIRIKSEQVGMETWLTRLLGALKLEASSSESARQALENIVVGGTP